MAYVGGMSFSALENPVPVTITYGVAFELLAACASTLIARGFLTLRQSRNLAHAAQLVSATDNEPTLRQWLYRLFLLEVNKTLGKAAMMLCVLAIGQKRIEVLGREELDSFRNAIAPILQSRLCTNEVLQILAAKLPTVTEDETEGAANIGSTSPSHERVNQDAASTEEQHVDKQQHVDGQTSVNDQAGPVLLPSLDGVAAVFHRKIFDAVERVAVPSGGTEPRASITMQFPQSGMVECLLSMHICDEAVRYIVGDMFNADVTVVDGLRYVAVKGRSTMIMPATELILRGVMEEYVEDTLGREVFCAIKESQIRRAEVFRGKWYQTECVSVNLMKQGAILNLVLGRERGIQIWEKLYNKRFE